MTLSKTRMIFQKSRTRWLALIAAAVAALAPIAAAHADAQYQADRQYCMSGQASEARSLCLKEAAAAQAERQTTSRRSAAHPATTGTKQHASGRQTKGASAG
jgi:hypothetical protein